MLATDDPPGGLRLLPMDGSAPRPIEAFRWRDVGACAGSRTTEVVLSLRPALILDNAVREDSQYTSPHYAHAVEAEVEVGPRGVCIRVLTIGREDDGFGWLTAGADGAFEGTSRCRPWVAGDPTPNVRWRPGMD